MVKEVASKNRGYCRRRYNNSNSAGTVFNKCWIKEYHCRCNPMDIKRGIDKAVGKVVDHLKSQAKVIGDDTWQN